MMALEMWRLGIMMSPAKVKCASNIPGFGAKIRLNLSEGV
jgi:hypothetical protein